MHARHEKSAITTCTCPTPKERGWLIHHSYTHIQTPAAGPRHASSTAPACPRTCRYADAPACVLVPVPPDLQRAPSRPHSACTLARLSLAPPRRRVVRLARSAPKTFLSLGPSRPPRPTSAHEPLTQRSGRIDGRQRRELQGVLPGQGPNRRVGTDAAGDASRMVPAAVHRLLRSVGGKEHPILRWEDTSPRGRSVCIRTDQALSGSTECRAWNKKGNAQVRERGRRI
ncbi:hypothetical protein K438DRAFT_1838425 [Mycena galopus ATCC 62051]|nr:hypothetical protein K438DRAFT_1838425 [Mycena galopus ATCC 62051]